MNLRQVSIGGALFVVVAACGNSADETVDATSTVSVDETTQAAGQDAATSTTASVAGTEPEPDGEAVTVSGAVLSIGDEEWTFDEVQFCGEPTEPATTSFLLLATQGEWQLFVEVNDETGERRLEGDGVYDTINLQNNGDTTKTWLANLEASTERFIVIDGTSVTVDTNFDAVTGLSDDTPGTLTATCP